MGSFHDKQNWVTLPEGSQSCCCRRCGVLSLSLSSVFFLLPLGLFLPFLFMNVHFCERGAWPFLGADLSTFAAAYKSMASGRSLLDMR